jgi:prephenate dehydrogenase
VKLAIVGVGLIGGSLGMAVRKDRLADTVVGVGRNPATLDLAQRLGAIDSFTTDFAIGVADADLVVLCTPIFQILSDLDRLPSLVSGGAVITDVGSTKGEIARAGDRAFPDGRFVPSHPMAGSEQAGVASARPNLFHEAVWALTPTEATDPSAVKLVRNLAQAVGARTIPLNPDDHDRAVALTSHLPHVLAYALAARAEAESGQNPRLFDLAAGSFASGTRVAASSPDLWRDIAVTNRSALLQALRAYIAALGEVETALAAGDDDNLLALFTAGYAAKLRTAQRDG